MANILKVNPATNGTNNSKAMERVAAVLNDSNGNDITITNPIPVDNTLWRETPFGEKVTASRQSKLNIKPTWGISTLRDSVVETGTGADVSESNGELRLQSGTSTSSVASITTKERGQYQAGTQGEIGIGVRIPSAPTGTQFAQWGYYTSTNGMGWGYDSTGLYVFYTSGSTQTKVYQTDWNKDAVDGTGNSGLTLNLATGNIFQIDFTWYGYGVVKYYINIKTIDTVIEQRILVHSNIVQESASIIDPNQPITCEVGNGASSTTNFTAYFGGRQFSYVAGLSIPKTRTTPVIREAFTLSSTSYVPVLAIRKKSTFNGRPNSIWTIIRRAEFISTQKVYWYISYGDSVTDGSWGSITHIPASETSLEMNTTLTAGNTTQNRKILQSVVTSSQNNKTSAGDVVDGNEIPIGMTDPIVIWAKAASTSATVDAILDFIEEW